MFTLSNKELSARGSFSRVVSRCGDNGSLLTGRKELQATRWTRGPGMQECFLAYSDQGL